MRRLVKYWKENTGRETMTVGTRGRANEKRKRKGRRRGGQARGNTRTKNEEMMRSSRRREKNKKKGSWERIEDIVM